MRSFNNFINERDEGGVPPVGDVQNKVAAVKRAWSQLHGIVDFFKTKILPTLPQEVIPDFMVAFEETLNSKDMVLKDEHLNYLINIIAGHNRFGKTAYLQSWPKNPPEWWTGGQWNKD